MTNGDFIRSMTDDSEKIDSSADIICPQKNCPWWNKYQCQYRYFWGKHPTFRFNRCQAYLLDGWRGWKADKEILFKDVWEEKIKNEVCFIKHQPKLVQSYFSRHKNS